MEIRAAEIAHAATDRHALTEFSTTDEVYGWNKEAFTLIDDIVFPLEEAGWLARIIASPFKGTDL